jgi:hypothetical protein
MSFIANVAGGVLWKGAKNILNNPYIMLVRLFVLRINYIFLFDLKIENDLSVRLLT